MMVEIWENLVVWSDVSQEMWNGVPQNEDLPVMLDDETTPVKACVDYPYNVNGSGKFSLEGNFLDLILLLICANWIYYYPFICGYNVILFNLNNVDFRVKCYPKGTGGMFGDFFASKETADAKVQHSQWESFPYRWTDVFSIFEIKCQW